jgi:hypothetical protein
VTPVDAVNALANRVRDLEAALRAAEGVLYALPRSAQSKRRSEVLRQVRAALAPAEER